MTMPTVTPITTIKTKNKEPNFPTELFFSMFKWFVIALVVTNIITSLIWAGVHYG